MADPSDDELLQIDNSIGAWSSKMSSTSDFQRLHNGISNNLTKMTNYTSDIERLVEKLGTLEDSESLRERYIHLQTETKSLMRQTAQDLEQLRSASAGNEADQRKRRSTIENLANQYLTTVKRFQTAQNIGARKEKDSLERARAVTFRQQSVQDSQIADNSSFSNTQMQQQVVLPVEQNVDTTTLIARDTQLRQLENDIGAVSELFGKVATMISEHGTIIDNIENNVTVAETSVISAVDDLGKGVKYQTSARRKKIMIIAIVIILLCLLGFGLYFAFKK